MRIRDYKIDNYNTLKECDDYVISQEAVTSDKAKNEVRIQLFPYWGEVKGFTETDKEYIKLCHFDIDMFETKEELDARLQELEEERTHFEAEQEEVSQRKSDYVKKIVSANKGEYKKGRKNKEEYETRLREEHDKKNELYTYFLTAMQRYVRRNRAEYYKKFKEEYDYMGLDELVDRALDDMKPDILADEVLRFEKDLMISRQELIEAAADYINNSGDDAKTSLSITSDEYINHVEEYLEKNRQKILVWSLLGLTVANTVILLLRTLICFYTLDRVIVSNNIIYIILSLAISAFAWVYMTTQEYFNYQKRKWNILWLVITNDIAAISQIVYTAVWGTAVVKLFSLKTGDVFTPSMVIFMARAVEILAVGLSYLALYKLVNPFVSADEAKEKILRFKLRHIVDNRKDKEYAYDFVVINDLDTGKPIIIKEHDLYTHMLVTGASGTGKTSSVYEPQIVENIQKKQENISLQQSAAYKMIKDGKVEVIKPFNRDKFSRQYLRVTDEKFQKEFDEIFDKYRECGITVVAPNNSMNEDILSYCSGRGIYVYNIDPTKKKATHKYEILAGMNPFYLPPSLHNIAPGDEEAEEERTILIAEAANNFADALTAINEQNGSGDQYFTDVNTTVTSAIATILMLHASISNTQVSIDDVYNHIVDFTLLENKVKDIKDHFNIHYKAVEEKKGKKNATVTDAALVNPNEGDEEKAEIEKCAEAYSSLSPEDKANPYIQTIITVENRLKKGSKMDEHAEGLRNLIGKLLQDPRVKRVLVKNPNIVDFDDILANNAITVVNTALQFGQNTSTCFGQLFLLSFNTAVLRRPKKLRSPHFFYEDETARYLNDTIDTMVTLYRQYNVACMFALQSLEQVEKIPKLKYLRNTLLSSGTTITFGRASYFDAETIANLGGQKRYMMVQHTRSYTSELSENASSSFSDRTTPDTKNFADPHDVRFRDFQECTITTTDNGNVLPARFGKANFVPKEVINGEDKEQITFNETWRKLWINLYPEAEDVMPVTAKTTLSSEEAQKLEELLKEKQESFISVSEEEIKNGTAIKQDFEASKSYSQEELQNRLKNSRVETITEEDDSEDELAGEDIEEEEDYSFFGEEIEMQPSVSIIQQDRVAIHETGPVPSDRAELLKKAGDESFMKQLADQHEALLKLARSSNNG